MTFIQGVEGPKKWGSKKSPALRVRIQQMGAKKVSMSCQIELITNNNFLEMYGNFGLKIEISSTYLCRIVEFLFLFLCRILIST